MLEAFNARKSCFLEKLGKVVSPVVLGDYDGTVLPPNQLGKVNFRRVIHNFRYISEAANLGPSEALLQKAETPIRGELRMSHQHKRDLYPLVEASHHPPREILHHKAVFILPRAVIRVEVEADFPKIVVGQKMVQQADGAVATFPDADPLVDQVVNLFESNPVISPKSIV